MGMGVYALTASPLPTSLLFIKNMYIPLSLHGIYLEKHFRLHARKSFVEASRNSFYIPYFLIQDHPSNNTRTFMYCDIWPYEL